MDHKPSDIIFKTHPGRGQHFLVDHSYANKILDSARLDQKDEVIEIGAGFGALTFLLSKRVSRIIAIELDERLVGYLEGQFSDKTHQVRIIHADVMDIDFKGLCKDFSNPPVVIGNLPYYLATSLIQRLLPLGAHLRHMVFLLQKEVVDRILARPVSKAYGYFSLIVEYFAEAEWLLDIPPSAFRPKPMVQSSLVYLTPRLEPLVKVTQEKHFFRVIKSGFSHRRKTLINALKLNPNLISTDIEAVCRDLGFAKNLRAEALTLEDFARLSNALVAHSL